MMNDTKTLCDCCISSLNTPINYIVNNCGTTNDGVSTSCMLECKLHGTITFKTGFVNMENNLKVAQIETKYAITASLLQIDFTNLPQTKEFIDGLQHIDNWMINRIPKELNYRPKLDNMQLLLSMGNRNIDETIPVTLYDITNDGNISKTKIDVRIDQLCDFIKNKKINITITLLSLALNSESTYLKYTVDKFEVSNTMFTKNVIQLQDVFKGNLLRYVFPKYLSLKDLSVLSKLNVNKNIPQVISNVIISKLVFELKGIFDDYNKFVDIMDKSKGCISGSFIVHTILDETKREYYDTIRVSKILETLNSATPVPNNNIFDGDIHIIEEEFDVEIETGDGPHIPQPCNTYNDVDIYFKNDVNYSIFREGILTIGFQQIPHYGGTKYNNSSIVNIERFHDKLTNQIIECIVLDGTDPATFMMTFCDMDISKNIMYYDNKLPIIKVTNLVNILNKHITVIPGNNQEHFANKILGRITKYKSRRFTFDIVSCIDTMMQLNEGNYCFSPNYTDFKRGDYGSNCDTNIMVYDKEQNMDVCSFHKKCPFSCALSSALIYHYHTRNYQTIFYDDTEFFGTKYTKEYLGKELDIVHIKDFDKYKDMLPESIRSRLVENYCDIIEVDMSTVAKLGKLNLFKQKN